MEENQAAKQIIAKGASCSGFRPQGAVLVTKDAMNMQP
jgi:hypothetical protein